ncbi:uncharacterized protein B0I36DRAFT_313368 [Microdochium trichocladiopsis]|uniref:2-dehydropantoate 2-reductase n=1 Tax=Microdochium trichocladiopsis TaxID=1682393 RepID=A0A9P9BU10_9PEZI|nr:uncharacterized protein B0I36DRAFT_313368 [Microdochium trichocladiopsis]KAH7037121.1 hypothetical protein B0I36DRAFT_313368 [Microdochium trichocladiopsis]
MITTKPSKSDPEKPSQRKKRLHVDTQSSSPALFAPNLFRTLGSDYREQRPGLPLWGTPPPPPELLESSQDAQNAPSKDDGSPEGGSAEPSDVVDKASIPEQAPVRDDTRRGPTSRSAAEIASDVTVPPAGTPPTATVPARTADQSAAPLSDRIHLGGFNVHARYLLHALVGLEGLPPVQVLTQHHQPSVAWAKEGRSISVHDHQGNLISARPFPCPQYVGPPKSKLRSLGSYGGKAPTIDNLLVALDDCSVEPFMRNLKRSITNNTTVCLLGDGLGMMEDLNARVFTDPASRPHYILGLSTHEVSTHSGTKVSIRHRWHKRGSALYLSTPVEYTSSVPFDRLDLSPRSQHLLDILSSSPELGARRLPWNRFIQRKLPGMIHSSLVDSISVMLGCRFNQIAERKHGRSLWNTMLSETLRIIAAMPEVEPEVARYFSSQKFRHELWAKLNRQGSTYSRWISLIRAGRRPPVDHINGYFVRRAQELGVNCKHNTTALSVVQFKYSLRRDELSRDVGLGLKPYMVDGDKLGGRESGDRDDFELDL